MEYKTRNFIPLPPGEYPAIITDVTEGAWPSGDPFITPTFQMEHPETLENVSIAPRVSPFISKSEKYKLFGELLALVKKDVGEEGEFDPQSLVGIECVAVTILEDDKVDPEKKWVRVVGVKKKASSK